MAAGNLVVPCIQSFSFLPHGTLLNLFLHLASHGASLDLLTAWKPQRRHATYMVTEDSGSLLLVRIQKAQRDPSSLHKSRDLLGFLTQKPHGESQHNPPVHSPQRAQLPGRPGQLASGLSMGCVPSYNAFTVRHLKSTHWTPGTWSPLCPWHFAQPLWPYVSPSPKWCDTILPFPMEIP